MDCTKSKHPKFEDSRKSCQEFGREDLDIEINTLKEMKKRNLIEDIDFIGTKFDDCQICIQGRQFRKPFPKCSRSETENILDLVHSDICGPMKTSTPSGNRYILTFIDDFSRYTFVYLLRSKDEVVDKYKEFINLMKNNFKKNVKVLRSDNGGEYMSKILNEILKENGTKHEFSAPYTPEQNGVAERKNRSLTEMARCMLIDGSMERKFWGEAVITANYLQNRLLTRSHGSISISLFLSHQKYMTR